MSLEKLKACDVWALGMSTFLLLNPDLEFLYQYELDQVPQKNFDSLKLTDEGTIEDVTILNRGKPGSDQDQDEGELFIVRRQYSWHKSTNDFCQIVSKVEHEGSFLRYAIVQNKVGDNCHHLSLLPTEMTREKTKNRTCEQNLLSWTR